MMVKICGITNREDALAAIEGGAAALGFNFYPASPRYITPEETAEIGAGLSAWPAVWKVGVFVDEPPERVWRIARQAGLDIAQLHGTESRENYPRGIRVWKAIRVRDGKVPEMLDFPAEAVLLDGPASGESFDWRNIPGMSRFAGKLILAGGLDAGNVRKAIEQAHPWGVDACSRLESAPGRKDHFKMAEFLKAALAATP
jgi:phosphoribosylanthranilate isomerase